MLYVRTYRGEIRQSQLERLNMMKVRLAERYRPLLQPMLEAASKVLGVAPEVLRRSKTPRREFIETRRVALDGEVFADGTHLIVLCLHTADPQQRHARTRPAPTAGAESPEAVYRLYVYAIGPTWEPESLGVAVSLAEEVLGVTLSPFIFKSDRFDALKAEGREPPSEPSPEELVGARNLRDRAVRGLALAIKSSGGLLVRDLSRQLPVDDRIRAEELIAALRAAGLIESEIVLVCSKTQAQVTRAPNREVLVELSNKGIKCACGRPLSEERMEEALAVTDLGRSLLDKARWLTILLVQELRTLGIGRETILVEQTVGGDEIDCIANISGELALFELKDKEFNLGNAYSFGAKIGITRPEHAVIFTTEHVGNDAREHFVRARLTGGQREERDVDLVALGDTYARFLGEGGPRKLTIIERVENLSSGLAKLVSAVYRKDAATLLGEVLPLAALEGQGLVRTLETPPEEEEAVHLRDSAEGAAASTQRRR